MIKISFFLIDLSSLPQDARFSQHLRLQQLKNIAQYIMYIVVWGYNEVFQREFTLAAVEDQNLLHNTSIKESQVKNHQFVNSFNNHRCVSLSHLVTHTTKR